MLPTQRKNISTMTAPIGTHVGEVFETMRNAVVELRLVWIGFGVRLGDALGYHLWIALLVTRVVAV